MTNMNKCGFETHFFVCGLSRKLETKVEHCRMLKHLMERRVVLVDIRNL